MFRMMENLLRGAAGVVLSPVAAVVDVVTLPESSLDPHRGPFERTGKMLKTVGECFDEALKPVKEVSGD